MADIRSITYQGAAVPAKSDTTADPLGPFVGVYVGGAGAVKVTTTSNQDVTFLAVPVGTIIPIAHTKVWNTGTSATNLVCFQALPYKAATS